MKLPMDLINEDSFVLPDNFRWVETNTNFGELLLKIITSTNFFTDWLYANFTENGLKK